MKDMKKIFLMALAGLLMACNGKISGNNNSGEDSTAVDQDSVVAKADEPSLRECTTFSTRFRKDENGQCDALILTCNIDTKKQEFTCEFNFSKDREYLGEAGEIEEVDINFDGVPDVLVTLGDFGVNPGLFPMIFYGAFVFNEATGEFEQVTDLEDKPNLSIDAKRKVIESNFATVVGDHYHEEYAWENGKLKLMEERQTNNYEDE